MTVSSLITGTFANTMMSICASEQLLHLSSHLPGTSHHSSALVASETQSTCLSVLGFRQSASQHPNAAFGPSRPLCGIYIHASISRCLAWLTGAWFTLIDSDRTIFPRMLSQPSIDMYVAKRSQQPLDANIFSARQRAALLQLNNHLALGDF